MRALSVKAASRAPSTVSGVKFYALRNQHGLQTGDVTDEILALPVSKAQRLLFHGIVTCEPASNFKLWGKDVAGWLLENHREHPFTMTELVAVQKAMEAGDVESIKVSAAWVASEKLKAEVEAKQAAEAKAAEAGVKAHAKEAKAQAAERERIEAARAAAMNHAGLPQDADEEEGEEEGAPPGPDASEGNSEAPLEEVTKPRKGRKGK